MALTIDGLVTGIDTDAIVKGLLDIQQQQIDQLTSRRDKVAVQQGAFQGIQSQLQALRGAAGTLVRAQNSVFDARAVNVSDESAVLATASNAATPGVYQLRVNSLARAHQVASQGFSSADAAITQGTVTLQVGASTPVTLTIDSTNDTLEGLATAINNSATGVAASIIRDGSAGGTPYRLLLTSQKTGASQSITLTNNLSASGDGAVQPAFDFDNPVQAAADASITLGDGPGAITVLSGTNTVNTLINGVTLSLRQADPSKTISVSVEADTEPATTAVTDFVNAYNELVTFIEGLSKFNAETQQGGILLGNRSARGVIDAVRSAMLESVPGLGGGVNRLTALGVSVADDGKLTFDPSALQTALRGENPKIDPASVKRLFALDGQSTNASVKFIIGTARTQASTTPYQIDITQAAERASITAGAALAESTLIDGTNNTLQLTIDGADSGALTLTSGTFSRQELAEHVEMVLNTATTLVGRSVSVSVENDRLVVTSDTYGTKSQVTVASASANAALGFSGGESDLGQDVAGTFLVNGVTETAVGRGQILTGDSENANTADLQVRITLTGADVIDGAEADITVTRGLAARLDKVLNDFLEPVSGRLKTIHDGLDRSIEDLQKVIDRQTADFEKQREAIVREFVALESAISELNNTSSFLASQLAGISGGGNLSRAGR